jgi:hypothetical protein
LPEVELVPAITARLMRSWECLPFREPLAQSLSLNHDWVWVALSEDEIIGCLIACECHGVALAVRVRMKEKSPVSALLILLRQFFIDCQARKLKGFVTILDNNSEIEVRIGDVMRKTFKGQTQYQSSIFVSAGFPNE